MQGLGWAAIGWQDPGDACGTTGKDPLSLWYSGAGREAGRFLMQNKHAYSCWFLLPGYLGQLIPARSCQLSSSLAKLLCFEILPQATSPNDVSWGKSPASPPLSQDDVQGEMDAVFAQETSG